MPGNFETKIFHTIHIIHRVYKRQIRARDFGDPQRNENLKVSIRMGGMTVVREASP